jgi:hypothetical protein
VLGYVDVAGRPAQGRDYEDYIKLDIYPENALSRKFLEVVREFIKNNDIILTESNLPSDRLVDYNCYVMVDDVKYVITYEQQDRYYDLLQNANAIKAAKFLSEIFELPLCVTYEFTKKNRYLTIVY